MKIILLSCIGLFFCAYSSLRDKNSRIPAQVNGNLLNYVDVSGSFRNERNSNHLKEGDVVIDLNSCNESTVIRGQKGVVNDRCEINFRNFNLFLNDRLSYGRSFAKGLSFDISNDRYLIFFSDHNLSDIQMKNEIRDILSTLSFDKSRVSVEGTKITLLGVIYIKM